MTLRIKTGPITLALDLMVLGIGMLLCNFGSLSSPQSLWKYWSFLLIGLGVEFFIRRLLQKDQEVVFHVPSTLLVGVIILIGIAVITSGYYLVIYIAMFRNFRYSNHEPQSSRMFQAVNFSHADYIV